MIWRWITGGLLVLYLVGRKGDTPLGYSDKVKKIAESISVAEGTSTADGSPVITSLGMRNNNPGDILDSSGNMISYGSLSEGWDALYRQVDLMLSGKSTMYQPGMPIIQVAGVYTGGDNPLGWAQAVAQHLGADINTSLADIVV